MKIYRLGTPSDKKGNPVSQLICIGKGYSLLEWRFSARGNRKKSLETYISPDWYWCGKKRWPTSDHPDGAVPGELFSQKAVNALSGLFDLENGDFFDLKNDNAEKYVMYIIWNRFDVVDMERPDIACGQLQTPVKMKIGYHTPPIFKSYHENTIWVTEEFKSAVESAGLTGFKFDFLGET